MGFHADLQRRLRYMSQDKVMASRVFHWIALGAGVGATVLAILNDMRFFAGLFSGILLSAAIIFSTLLSVMFDREARAEKAKVLEGIAAIENYANDDEEEDA